MVQLTKNFGAVAMDSFHHFSKGLNVSIFAHCKLAGGKRSMLFINTCGLCDDKPHAAFGALGVQDRARHLATLYLDDLADVLREAVGVEVHGFFGRCVCSHAAYSCTASTV